VTGAVFLFLSKLFYLVWGLASFPRMSDWLISPSDLTSFVLVTATALFIRRRDDANRFLNEAVGELIKVSWPNRQETLVSTGISCVLVAICALVLLGYDSLWGTILKGVFKF